MPTVPGAGLVVVEAQLVLGGFEAVLDRPAMPLDQYQGLDSCSRPTLRGEERQIAISDVAADQEPARPPARSILIIFGGVKIGELEIGPVMESRALGSLARRQPLPDQWVEASRDLAGSAGDGGLAGPDPK